MQETDREIQRQTQEQVKLRQEQASLFRDLARVRLNLINQGAIVAGFDDAERHVQDLLRRRNEKLELLERQGAEIQTRRKELEEQRAAQQSQIAAASSELDRVEGEVQRRLRGEPAYQTQLAKAQQVDGVARHAEEKSLQVERDHAEKGKPFEADRLFQYLWNRQYGTSHYRANRLLERLDGWVARLCRYSESRPNYQALREIPQRLATHAKRSRQLADREFATLSSLEAAAAEAGGVLPLRERVEQERQAADRLDAAIKAQEEQFEGIMRQRSKFAGGEDDDFRLSQETLMRQLQREPLPELMRQAEATPTPEDNVIVRRLADLEQFHGQVLVSLERAKQLHERNLDRVRQLEQVRRDFKQNRFDDVHSVFPDGAIVATMLTSFLRGLTTSGELWNTIQRQQRYRKMDADPTFGSGSILGPGGGTWSFPFPTGGGGFGGGFPGGIPGGFGFPTGGGRSSGGQDSGGKSGGGFAPGQDFRTGGTF